MRWTINVYHFGIRLVQNGFNPTPNLGFWYWVQVVQNTQLDELTNKFYSLFLVGGDFSIESIFIILLIYTYHYLTA